MISLEDETSLLDLPEDLLSSILSHLLAGDFLSFRMTCKYFQSIFDIGRLPTKDSPLSQYPSLFVLENNKIFHPFYDISHDIDDEIITPAIIQVSMYGWFLMTHACCDIFFFNPTTKVKIQLPDTDEDHKLMRFHFNAPPNSTECEVIGFVSVLNKKVEIIRIKRGEVEWNIYEFRAKWNFESSECNPILYNGIYYCLGRRGGLLIYDPVKNECEWTDHSNALSRRLRPMYCQSYMVESDGDLLAVFVARDGRWVGVFRLNLSSWLFEQITDLGDRILYVSHPACFSEVAVVSGSNNKIYLPRFHKENGMFYSLGTKKFHSFGGYNADNFYGDQKGFAFCTWVKPRVDSNGKEEFAWSIMENKHMSL